MKPYDENRVNPNSYNMSLFPQLRVYTKFPLDSRKENPTRDVEIPPEGLTLQPGVLYLGASVEFTETKHWIPGIDGRSSGARLGVSIHQTGGFGDLGFGGTWTFEITVVHPTIIYPLMEFAQLQWDTPDGEITDLYGEDRRKGSGKYHGQMQPTASKWHEDAKTTEGE